MPDSMRRRRAVVVAPVLLMSECFEAFQNGLNTFGVKVFEALSEARSDAGTDCGSGTGTLLGQVDPRPPGVVAIDPPLDQPGLGELGQCATDDGGVETEVADQPAGCVDTELDGAQREEVSEVEIRGRRDTGPRVGQHGLVEPEEGVEEPQLRCYGGVTHEERLPASNY